MTDFAYKKKKFRPGQTNFHDCCRNINFGKFGFPSMLRYSLAHPRKPRVLAAKYFGTLSELFFASTTGVGKQGSMSERGLFVIL